MDVLRELLWNLIPISSGIASSEKAGAGRSGVPNENVTKTIYLLPSVILGEV